MHSCCVSSIYDVNNVLCFCCPVFKFSRKSSFCKANRRWWPNRKWPQGSEWDAQHGIGCWTCASGRESSLQTLRGLRTQVWSSYLNETHKREWSRGHNDYTEIHKENKYLADYISNYKTDHTNSHCDRADFHIHINPKSTIITIKSCLTQKLSINLLCDSNAHQDSRKVPLTTTYLHPLCSRSALGAQRQSRPVLSRKTET